MRLFGRNKAEAEWDQAGDIVPVSPRKRYRRGDRGQLVPRHFARVQSEDTCQQDSQRESRDEEDTHEESSETAMKQGEAEHVIVDSHAILGIAPSKPRPAMLDMRDLNESDPSDDDTNQNDEIETPLMMHPLASDHESNNLTYGRDMVYGQDPDGFELTTTHTRRRTVDIENPRIANIKQQQKNKAKNGDPPTAAEHRRTRSSRNMR